MTSTTQIQEDAATRDINAFPTKTFFISVLVRDIDLIAAIVDLVDNSVDGARRLRPDNDYSGFWVRIEVGREQFRISDNCGGIPVELARKYAFRFGRDPDMPPTHHSIGQFGVGMKRALFKMGRNFRVESTTATTRFVVDVDVEEWKRDENDWTFDFAELDTELEGVSEEEQGTEIQVTNLYNAVATDFAFDQWQDQLREAVMKKHSENVRRGLAMTLNQEPLGQYQLTLFQSSQLKPAFKELSFNGSGDPVTVKLYAGVSESDPHQAGWYVFCNGRMIVEADQSEDTGWGVLPERVVPKYHNQFARFRGYAFFDCDDPSRLPWTTIKSGIDLDSDVYRSVRQDMVKLARPVIDFLNSVDREVDVREEQGDGPLLTIIGDIEKSGGTEIHSLPESDKFSFPKPRKAPPKPKVAPIRYSRPRDQVERLMEYLGVRSFKKVGEYTYDYFVESEGIE